VTETPYRLEYYLEDDGRAPFTEWLSTLRDRDAHARINLGTRSDCVLSH